MVRWLEHHQVPLLLASITVGTLVGLLAPASAPVLELSINPILALLLFATFLSVPLVQIGRAFLDARFLVTVLVTNFVVAPAVAFALSRFVAHDQALLLGVLLVLLTPCVDYVIVFTGMAGGARDRLLAAAPVLMLVQLLLLPVYLWLFAGPDAMQLIDIAPFAQAFVVLIVIPLIAAAVVQQWSKTSRSGRAVESAMAAAMIPLLMLTLAVVIGSQVADVSEQLGKLLVVVPIYLAFAAAMLAWGIAAGRLARLNPPGVRALAFSGVTRNSLVVLPLALALPDSLRLAPLTVVTQTLVELLLMVLLVWLVPRLVPAGGART